MVARSFFIDIEGELDLAVADDFVPQLYEPLQIIGADFAYNFEGTFDSVTNVILNDEYGLAVTYGTDEVLVTVARLVSVPEPAGLLFLVSGGIGLVRRRVRGACRN